MPTNTDWLAVAREQLYTARDHDGELGHFLRGLEGDRDATARLSPNTYEQLRHCLLGDESDPNILLGPTADLVGSDGAEVEAWACDVTAAPSGEPRCFLFVVVEGEEDPVFAEDAHTAT